MSDATGPKIKKQPKGVALIIGPWNYPWQCNLCPLVGAIAAGCPAIVKVCLPHSTLTGRADVGSPPSSRRPLPLCLPSCCPVTLIPRRTQ